MLNQRRIISEIVDIAPLGTSTNKPSGEPQIPPALKAKIDKIDEASIVLLREPTPTSLHQYKRLVKDFVESMINYALSLNTEVGYGIRKKVFATVTSVDRNMMDLTDAVMGYQVDLIRASKLVEECKGLLIDVFS